MDFSMVSVLNFTALANKYSRTYNENRTEFVPKWQTHREVGAQSHGPATEMKADRQTAENY